LIFSSFVEAGKLVAELIFRNAGSVRMEDVAAPEESVVRSVGLGGLEKNQIA
jgi:hypothetical protein